MNCCIKGIIRQTSCFLSCAAALLVLETASATIYVKDSVPLGGLPVNYNQASLMGQNPSTAAIIGDSAAWGGSSGTGVIIVSPTGLSYPAWVSLASSGGSFVNYNATVSTTATDGGRLLSRPISGLPTSGDFYMSLLIGVQDAAALTALQPGQSRGAGLGTTTATGSITPVLPADGVYFGFQNVGGVRSLMLKVKGTNYALVNNPVPGQTYFCVAKIEIGQGTGGKDIVRASVDPVVPDSYSVTVEDNVLISGATFPYFNIGGCYPTASKNVYYDEVLVADTWQEVAPINANYPGFLSSPTVLPNEFDQMIFSATLDGGASATSLYACYGTTAGGSTYNSWQNDELLAESPVLGVPATIALTSLAPNTSYYYGVVATNSTYSVLKLGSTFLNGEVWLTAGSDAQEEGLVPGSILVHRPASATQAPLPVNYLVSGSAVQGVNYNGAALTGTVTIPAGQDTASLVVTPLMDAATPTNRTVTITLAGGAYFVSSTNEASIDIVSADIPPDKNVWVGSGNASNAANWSQGVPQVGDDILLSIFSSGNMIWDVDGVNSLTDTVSSWTQDEFYTGTVTFPIQYAAGAAFTNFTVNGNVLINAGTWTHTANTSAQTYRLKATINGTLTVGPGGTISALGKGYNNGGKINGCHGGNANNVTGSTYGDPKYPTAIGACNGTSAGGGAILLDVAGAAVFNGAITAAGMTASDLYGGAGGSILIDAPSISGSGSMNANGAMGTKNDWYGAAGSGGRIALLTDGALAFPTNLVTAYGRMTGADGSGTGAGTIFLKKTGDAHGTLIVANSSAGQAAPSSNGFKSFGKNAVTPVNPGETWTFDAVQTKGYGVLSVPVNTTLILPNGLASVSSLDTTTPVLDGLRYEGGTLDIGTFTTHTVAGGWCFQAAKPYTISGNLQVSGGASVGICRLRQVVASGYAGYYGCDLTVTGNMTVNADSFIEGRHGGFWNYDTTFPHVTHGGLSGYLSSAAATDSILDPVLPAGGVEGNSSLYAGGGVVKLTVGGTLELNGIAYSTGFQSVDFIDLDVASPGGTFNFTVGALTGSGSIAANGGINTRRMGTGGGRVAIRLTNPEATFDAWRSKIDAYGRTVYISSSYAKSGGAGTLYLETAAESDDAGLIIVKNDNNVNNLIKTPIPATGTRADTVASLKKASLSIERCGRALLTGNLKLESLAIESNSTIDLAGYQLTLTEMTNNGIAVPAGTYAAASFASGVTDSSGGHTGRVVVLGQATMLIVR